jgi:F-type H+-transporting ATPase subunit a
MGLEFLARVRRSSLIASGVTALLAATYVSPLGGLGLLAGALFCLFNLELIGLVVTGLTSPDRGTKPAQRRLAIGLGGMPPLFGAGALLLFVLPAGWLVTGFLLPFAVLTLKAASLLVLASPAWAALTRSPWRATFAVAACVALLWIGSSALPHAGLAAGTEPEHAAATETHAAGEHAEPAEGEGEKKELGFPTVVTLLEHAAPHAAWVEWVVRFEPVLFSILIALLLCIPAWLASRNPTRIPTTLQNLVEAIVDFLSRFVVDILGPKYGPRYVPFLGTLFIYIFAMNVFGLIPFMHSPTASLNVTVALALTVFFYVQYTGLTELGLLGWADHMLGSPRDLTGWLLAPIMLPIHLLGELAKPISLSCRLFGNIFGEDMLLVAFATLGISMLSFLHLPFGLPLHALFFPLALLGSALQAMVFTVLSTIYFLLMLPHESHDDHGHETEAHPAH